MAITDTVLRLVKALGQLFSEDRFGSDEALLEELCSTDEVPLDLARAVLLVDLAMIDARFDAREYEFIVNVLCSNMGISEDEAVSLIKTASSMIQFRGSHSFAVELQKRLSLEQRQHLADEISRIISADGQQDGFEIYLSSKLRDMLGVGLQKS